MSQSHDRRGGSEPELPRHEPEIIPPGGRAASDRSRGAEENVFVYVDRDGTTHRVNVKAPGPFTIIMVLLAVGLVAALILALILGALFFLIPIAAVALAGLIAYAYGRGLWRRLMGR